MTSRTKPGNVSRNLGCAIVVDVGDYTEGTKLQVEVANDEMDGEERLRLHAALEASWAQAQRGETISGEEVLARLRKRS